MVETSEALTVMIVDDEQLLRKVVEIYFGNRGYRVISAATGLDCLEKMRQSAPDAVLLDVMMPGMEGWEVCRRIREFSDVPVIMLTARALASDREMGVAAGVSDYVIKPTSLKELEARIRVLVRRPLSAAATDAPLP